MITTPEAIVTQEITTAVVPLKIPGQDMGKYMDAAIQEVIKTITGQGIAITGPLFSFHKRRPGSTFDFELGFPVAAPIKAEGRVVNSKLPAAKVVRAVYQGPYDDLGKAWGALQQWVREHGHGESGRFWESYLNAPDEVRDPREYRTELNWIAGD
ncbi:MAG: GyrI-like domain-containing protein [Bacteroidetes bacterium]|nr:GyrI-like domain-containing protein [Bacteroidota bacterium]